MVPESHMRNEVVKYLNELTSNVYSLTAISIATVFVTSILLFITVEDSLNKIFAVRLTPAWQRSVLTFTGLFFWGPTLMGLSSFLWIRGLTFAAFSSMTGTQWGHSLITFAVSWLLFVASYYFLPYGNTSLRSSILGGFVGASLWECAKWLFGLYLQEAFVYSRVYGSVAFIPLSLLWIYVSWVIFLFGATVSFCYQFRDMLDMLGSDAEHDPILLTQATLASLMVIARRFRSGDPPVTIYDLSQLIKAPSHLIQSGLLALAEKRILHPINRKCDTFLPARSLENVSMMDAFWATFPKTPNLRGALAEIELAGELMNHARDAMQAVLSNQTLAQFLENPRLSAK
jgi:membrane protein